MHTDDITIENWNWRRARRSTSLKTSNLSCRFPWASRWIKLRDLYPIKVPVNDIVLDQKVALLYEIDKFTRGLDARVKNVFCLPCQRVQSYFGRFFARFGSGRYSAAHALNVTCIAEEDGDRQVGSFGGGGRVEFGFFIDAKDYERYAREAVRQAILNLSALDAPAGTMDVVLGPGWPGILLHEAIGHGLEVTSTGSRLPLSGGRIGQRVASELCTVVDDGTIPSRRGSINVDDEGTRHTGRFSSKMVFSTAISKIVSTRRS